MNYLLSFFKVWLRRCVSSIKKATEDQSITIPAKITAIKFFHNLNI